MTVEELAAIRKNLENDAYPYAPELRALLAEVEQLQAIIESPVAYDVVMEEETLESYRIAAEMEGSLPVRMVYRLLGQVRAYRQRTEAAEAQVAQLREWVDKALADTVPLQTGP